MLLFHLNHTLHGIFNTSSLNWDPPVAKPTTGGPYDWDEDTQAWVQAVAPGAQ